MVPIDRSRRPWSPSIPSTDPPSKRARPRHPSHSPIADPIIHRFHGKSARLHHPPAEDTSRCLQFIELHERTHRHRLRAGLMYEPTHNGPPRPTPPRTIETGSFPDTRRTPSPRFSIPIPLFGRPISSYVQPPRGYHGVKQVSLGGGRIKKGVHPEEDLHGGRVGRVLLRVSRWLFGSD